MYLRSMAMNRLPRLFCAPMVLVLGAGAALGQGLPVETFRSDRGNTPNIDIPSSSRTTVDPGRPKAGNPNARHIADPNARVAQGGKLPYGNLKPLKISVEKSGFTLNGVDLEAIKVESA